MRQGGVQGQTLAKIPEGSFKKRAQSEQPGSIKTGSDKLKSMKLTETEFAFLKQYRELEDLEREKGIKFFECVGDPPATEDYKEAVRVKR